MIRSWGNYPKVVNVSEKSVLWCDDKILFSNKPVLAFGNGRSYGDVAINNNGTALHTKQLNRFISFNENNGVLHCESGCLLSDVLSSFVPRGWTLPVVPGTRFVTVGGAIANDVHGKNHHVMGTFGSHVIRFFLLRSTGEILECSLEKNQALFSATIGGIGLTGLILSAEIQLVRLQSEFLSVQTQPFYGIQSFFDLSKAAELSHEHTVGWLDCQSVGKKFGRGLFMKANYLNKQTPFQHDKKGKLNVPSHFPSFLLNRYTIQLFNDVYFHMGSRNPGLEKISHYAPFFFPLDSIENWNRIYGQEGFFQYQCVVPMASGIESINQLLKVIVDSKQGSFLSVLKVFGEKSSPGLLSFPMPGVTLALDFKNKGKDTLRLLDRLDEIVMSAGGRVYLAKDARLNAEQFMHYYGLQWEAFMQYKDPAFSSTFFKRVTE